MNNTTMKVDSIITMLRTQEKEKYFLEEENKKEVALVFRIELCIKIDHDVTLFQCRDQYMSKKNPNFLLLEYQSLNMFQLPLFVLPLII